MTNKILKIDDIEYRLEKTERFKTFYGLGCSKGYNIFRLPENYRLGHYDSIAKFREDLKDRKRRMKQKNKR